MRGSTIIPLLVLATACQGILFDGSGGTDGRESADESTFPEPGGGGTQVTTPDGQTIDCAAGLHLGSAPMRRLSHREYMNTLADLFPGASASMPTLPPDAAVVGLENNAASMGPSDLLLARYEDAAFRFTSEATASEEALAELTGCASWGTTDEMEECAQAFIESFGLRTHRRPLEQEEQARYLEFFEAQQNAIDFAAGIQLVAMAMLQSPHFLYRLELSTGEPGEETVPLSDWEMASRLAFFFLQTSPDQELFEAAAAGELREPEQIEAQARRLLEDPRAAVAIGDFERQWLHVGRILDGEHASRENDPQGLWTETAQYSAAAELEHFLANVSTISDLFTSRHASVDSTLAALYGIEGPSEPESWLEVELPAAERAGLLTRIGFLAAYSHGGNPSPPLRGLYVMEHILCEQPPAVPPEADTSAPVAPEGQPVTNRALFEERTADPPCYNCHVRIDGFGFTFENYDEMGVFRTEDNGLPVDATGQILGTDVDGPVDGALELSESLAMSQTVHACALDRTWRYAVGRGIERADRCLLAPIAEEFFEGGGDIRELMVKLATLAEFRTRPAVEESP